QFNNLTLQRLRTILTQEYNEARMFGRPIRVISKVIKALSEKLPNYLENKPNQDHISNTENARRVVINITPEPLSTEAVSQGSSSAPSPSSSNTSAPDLRQQRWRLKLTGQHTLRFFQQGLIMPTAVTAFTPRSVVYQSIPPGKQV